MKTTSHNIKTTALRWLIMGTIGSTLMACGGSSNPDAAVKMSQLFGNDTYYYQPRIKDIVASINSRLDLKPPFSYQCYLGDLSPKYTPNVLPEGVVDVYPFTQFDIVVTSTEVEKYKLLGWKLSEDQPPYVQLRPYECPVAATDLPHLDKPILAAMVGDNHDAISHKLMTVGSASVEIELNVAIPFSLNRDGSTKYLPDADSDAQIANRLDQLITQSKNWGGMGLAEVDTGPASAPAGRLPHLYATVDKNSYESLITNENVRAVRLRGSFDTRHARWSKDLLSSNVKDYGLHPVHLTLRGGTNFADYYALDEDTRKYQTAAFQSAMREILTEAGASIDLSTNGLYLEYGSIVAYLPKSVIENLFKLRDKRLLSVESHYFVGPF